MNADASQLRPRTRPFEHSTTDYSAVKARTEEIRAALDPHMAQIIDLYAGDSVLMKNSDWSGGPGRHAWRQLERTLGPIARAHGFDTNDDVTFEALSAFVGKDVRHADSARTLHICGKAVRNFDPAKKTERLRQMSERLDAATRSELVAIVDGNDGLARDLFLNTNFHRGSICFEIPAELLRIFRRNGFYTREPETIRAALELVRDLVETSATRDTALVIGSAADAQRTVADVIALSHRFSPNLDLPATDALHAADTRTGYLRGCTGGRREALEAVPTLGGATIGTGVGALEIAQSVCAEAAIPLDIDGKNTDALTILVGLFNAVGAAGQTYGWSLARRRTELQRRLGKTGSARAEHTVGELRAVGLPERLLRAAPKALSALELPGDFERLETLATSGRLVPLHADLQHPKLGEKLGGLLLALGVEASVFELCKTFHSVENSDVMFASLATIPRKTDAVLLTGENAIPSSVQSAIFDAEDISGYEAREERRKNCPELDLVHRLFPSGGDVVVNPASDWLDDPALCARLKSVVEAGFWERKRQLERKRATSS